MWKKNYMMCKESWCAKKVMLTKDNKLKINVKGSPISKEKIVKLLGVTVDNKLSF